MVNQVDNRLGVILAEGRSSIWGKSQDVPTSLVTICGKPLLAQRIDEFRDLGIQRIMVLSEEKKAIEAARIGLNAFSLSLDILTPREVAIGETEKILIASAERFFEPVFSMVSELPSDTIVHSRCGDAIAASVTSDNFDTAVRALRGDRHDLNSLPSTAVSVEIDSVDAFIGVNLDVLRGSLSIPRISGLSVAPNVYLEWVLSAKPANIRGAAHIGDGAVLHPTARVQDCVIGRQATILPYAKLDRCVVLAGAVVPENADYSEAIISDGLTVFGNANDTARELERFSLESAVR